MMFVSSSAIATAATAAVAATAASVPTPKRRRGGGGGTGVGSTGGVVIAGSRLEGSRGARSAHPVADVRVAADARGLLVRVGGDDGDRDRPAARVPRRDVRPRLDRGHHLLVAVAAGALRHLPVPLRDAERVGIGAGREVEGVP